MHDSRISTAILDAAIPSLFSSDFWVRELPLHLYICYYYIRDREDDRWGFLFFLSLISFCGLAGLISFVFVPIIDVVGALTL